MKRPLHAGGSQSRGVSLKMFSDDEVDAIHSATLEVLDKTGIFIEDEEALEIFHGGGATVDKKNKVVHIPPMSSKMPSDRPRPKWFWPDENRSGM